MSDCRITACAEPKRTCLACGLLPICAVGQYRAKHPECPVCGEWCPPDDAEAAARVRERADGDERMMRR